MVLRQYDLKVEQLMYIRHGENATFKIITRKGSYLLRIHRNDAHILDAIKEELAWLNKLNSSGFSVQKPIPSKYKKLITHGEYKEGHLKRRCTVLTWQEGVFRTKSLTLNQTRNYGRLFAQLHKTSCQIPVNHRNYWHSDGLLGKDDRFNGLFAIKDALTKKEYAIFNECRETLLGKIKDYELKFPKKSGLIHADLNLWNLLWQGNNPVPIDFDDCGAGLHFYDICSGLNSLEIVLSTMKSKQLATYFDAFLDGYGEFGTITQADLDILPFIKLTRNVVMFSRCYSRRDNPSIFKHFEKGRKIRMERYTKFLKEGPEPFFT